MSSRYNACVHGQECTCVFLLHMRLRGFTLESMNQSPTVRRRRLGAQLRSAREAVDLTRETVAEALGTSIYAVGRWETGRSAIRQSDLRALLDIYRVHNTFERAELETLAREGRQRGWWTPYTSAIKPTFATFLGLESEAASLMEYSAIVVPGLLQTQEYMRAVMSAAVPMLGDETMDKRIEVRLKRQADMLTRGYPTHFVIDEACLWRRVGGGVVMRQQLDQLLELARSRYVTVQVLAFEVGAHASTLGSFSVLAFDHDPPIACVEELGGDLYADGPDAVRYSQHFDKLREAALPEPLSLSLIGRVKEEAHPC